MSNRRTLAFTCAERFNSAISQLSHKRSAKSCVPSVLAHPPQSPSWPARPQRLEGLQHSTQSQRPHSTPAQRTPQPNIHFSKSVITVLVTPLPKINNPRQSLSHAPHPLSYRPSWHYAFRSSSWIERPLREVSRFESGPRGNPISNRPAKTPYKNQNPPFKANLC